MRPNGHAPALFDDPPIARKHDATSTSGTAVLRDQLAWIDLGHSEKRFNRPIKLTTLEENQALRERQYAASDWVSANPKATVNRSRSYRLLFTHPALPSVSHFPPQLLRAV